MTTIAGRSYPAVWDAAVRAAGAHFDIVESDQNLGIIHAEGRTQAEGRGQAGPPAMACSILISPPLVGADAYRVEVLARRGGRAGRAWERQLIREIRDLLEAGSSLEGLPLAPWFADRGVGRTGVANAPADPPPSLGAMDERPAFGAEALADQQPVAPFA